MWAAVASAHTPTSVSNLTHETESPRRAARAQRDERGVGELAEPGSEPQASRSGSLCRRAAHRCTGRTREANSVSVPPFACASAARATALTRDRKSGRESRWSRNVGAPSWASANVPSSTLAVAEVERGERMAARGEAEDAIAPHVLVAAQAQRGEGGQRRPRLSTPLSLMWLDQ